MLCSYTKLSTSKSDWFFLNDNPLPLSIGKTSYLAFSSQQARKDIKYYSQDQPHYSNQPHLVILQSHHFLLTIIFSQALYPAHYCCAHHQHLQKIKNNLLWVTILNLSRQGSLSLLQRNQLSFFLSCIWYFEHLESHTVLHAYQLSFSTMDRKTQSSLDFVHS